MLCAEDNPYARVVLNTILTELGHRADFAGTGEAAVAAVERGAYDVVLMDVTLPGLDGLAAARLIRGLPDGVARRAHHRHVGPHRAGRRRGRARRRHERFLREAGQPGRAGVLPSPAQREKLPVAEGLRRMRGSLAARVGKKPLTPLPA